MHSSSLDLPNFEFQVERPLLDSCNHLSRYYHHSCEQMHSFWVVDLRGFPEKIHSFGRFLLALVATCGWAVNSCIAFILTCVLKISSPN